MVRRLVTSAILLMGACTLLTGCMPTMTIDQMKASMPERPAELDRLETFLGEWTHEGEAKFAMLEEPIKTSGTSEAKWGGNRWYTVGHMTFNMEHFGESEGVECWTYDMHSKKYRSTWVDSMGMSGTGVGTFDEKTDTWHMTATSHGPWGKSTMKGQFRFTDPNTMEWTWSERQGLMKVMEMKGTSKRVR